MHSLEVTLGEWKDKQRGFLPRVPPRSIPYSTTPLGYLSLPRTKEARNLRMNDVPFRNHLTTTFHNTSRLHVVEAERLNILPENGASKIR